MQNKHGVLAIPKWWNVLVLLVILMVALSPGSTVPTFAANCYGSTCTGYYAPGMGCSTTSSSGHNFGAGVYVEHRYSGNCNAEWERTTNLSGVNRYAAGSERYGCANYCYAQSVSSPAAIANGELVYTRMVGPAGATPTLSCGALSTSHISTPVTTSCIGPY